MTANVPFSEVCGAFETGEYASSRRKGAYANMERYHITSPPAPKRALLCAPTVWPHFPEIKISSQDSSRR